MSFDSLITGTAALLPHLEMIRRYLRTENSGKTHISAHTALSSISVVYIEPWQISELIDHVW